MKTFWNEKFAEKEYLYGETPNFYFASILPALAPGKALFAAEGEGRNATFASRLGWTVSAFDQSEQAQRKAVQLAEKTGTKLEYKVIEMEEVAYPPAYFDLLVLVYAHFPEVNRRKFHRKLISYVKTGGKLILEGFSKHHVNNQRKNPQAGGPKDMSMLYELDLLKEDFEDFYFMDARETDVELCEGSCHVGRAAVTRIFATKKTV